MIRKPDAPIDAATVFVSLPSGREVLAGELRNDLLGASQLPTPTFRYAPDFLTTPGAYPLSPDLPLTAGPLRPAIGRTILGAFGDAMPDDWGRSVMHRARIQISTQLDYLANVQDRYRQGAIRIALDGEFVAYDDGPLERDRDVALNKWMKAALAFDAGTETASEVEELVHAGTSAGGARPKVVIAEGNTIRIVKFPRSTELWNQMAWEGVALELARRCQIDVPNFWVPKLGDKLGLMVERFDRTPSGDRVGYISAHTLVQQRDGQIVDYTTLVEDLAMVSSNPRRDSHELFSRIALFILLNNVDDHMRNHGFVRDKNGWALSPLFDVEPQRELGRTEATPIQPGGSGADRSLGELLDSADAFSLTRPQAARLIGSVELGTRDWATVALGFGIHHDQLAVWSKVFDGINRDEAVAIAADADD